MSTKTSQGKHQIVEKVPLKNKILMKAVIPEKAQLMVAQFSPEDTMAACGYSDGLVRIFNLGTDNKICQINTSSKQPAPVNALRWRPTNETSISTTAVLLVANTNGNIYQYAAKTGKQLFHTYEEDNYVLALDYTPSGDSFCTAGKDNAIRIYDEQTKKIKHKLASIMWHKQGHNNRLFSVKYKKEEPNILVSGGWDQNVNIWDIRTESVVSSIYGAKIAGDSLDIRDNFVLIGANRGKDQLQLWDWREKKLVQTLKWNQYQGDTDGSILCAQFCKYNRSNVIAVGGTDAKFFDINEYIQLLEINFDKDNILYSCDSGSSGTRFLIGGKNGTLFYCGNNKSLE